MEYLSDTDNLLSYENKLWEQEVSFVVGVDEVGRGPLAGPVVAAAVMFVPGSKIPFVDDSKKLTERRREELYDAILAVDGVRYGIVELSAQEVDALNILKATHVAMNRAVQMVDGAEYALIDGLPVPSFCMPSEGIVKGDSKSASIAAASILAKVYRDRLMVEYSKEFPGYGFEKHKGYGTKQHLAALKELGVCPIHRRSFAPVRDVLSPPPEQGAFDF